MRFYVYKFKFHTAVYDSINRTTKRFFIFDHYARAQQWINSERYKFMRNPNNWPSGDTYYTWRKLETAFPVEFDTIVERRMMRNHKLS